MTVQQKLFIELTDIVSLRFECKTCHAALQICLDSHRHGILRQCPACNADWALMNNGMASKNAEMHFQNFMTVIKNLEALTKDVPLGFQMYLEIKSPPETQAS